MKVKVIRKRRPAPVAAEQGSKAICRIKSDFNGMFGIPQKIVFDDYSGSELLPQRKENCYEH